MAGQGRDKMYTSYKKGYNFERRVRKYFEGKGWLVFRQGKSAFPDLICLRGIPPVAGIKALGGEFTEVLFVECKVNKYLSKEEKEEAYWIMKSTNAPFWVAYRKNRKIEFDVLCLKNSAG